MAIQNDPDNGDGTVPNDYFDKYRGSGASYGDPSPENIPPVADPVAAFLYECERWAELTRWMAYKTESLDRDTATDDAVRETAAEISELQRQRCAVRNSLQSLQDETVARVLQVDEDSKPIFSLVRAAGSAASQFGEHWFEAYAVLKATQAKLRAAEQKDESGVIGIPGIGPVPYVLQKGTGSGAVPLRIPEPTTDARKPESERGGRLLRRRASEGIQRLPPVTRRLVPFKARNNARAETLHRLRDAIDELTERVSRFAKPLHDPTGTEGVIAIADRVRALQEEAKLPRMVRFQAVNNPDVVGFRVYDPNLPEKKGAMGGLAMNPQSSPTTWRGNEYNVPLVLEYLGCARRFVERAIRDAVGGHNGKGGGGTFVHLPPAEGLGGNSGLTEVFPSFVPWASNQTGFAGAEPVASGRDNAEPTSDARHPEPKEPESRDMDDTTNGDAPPKPEYKWPREYELDKWIYGNIHEMSFPDLSVEHEILAERKGWTGPFSSRNAYKNRAERYAKFHQLPQRNFDGEQPVSRGDEGVSDT